MKRFLIIASMICVLVSSLVVVSFADEVDSSEKYNYSHYVELNFIDLPTSTPQSTYIEFGLDSPALLQISADGSDPLYLIFDRVTARSSRHEGDYYAVVYAFYIPGQDGFAYQLSLIYDASSVFSSAKFNDRFGNDHLLPTESVDMIVYYDEFLEYSRIPSDNLIITKGLVEDPRSPSYLLSLLFTGFGTAIGGLALGIKESLSNVIWVDPFATDRTLSPLVTFIFTIAGLGIGMTVFYMVFRLIRFGRQR